MERFSQSVRMCPAAQQSGIVCTIFLHDTLLLILSPKSFVAFHFLTNNLNNHMLKVFAWSSKMASSDGKYFSFISVLYSGGN